MNRIGKQFIYGVAYGIIFLIFLVVIYFLFLKQGPTCADKKQNQNEEGVDCGGPCLPCLGKPRDIVTDKSIIFFSKEPIIFVQLKNPNNHVGAKNIPYKIEVLDNQDDILRTFQGETFVYPGDQEKYLIFPVSGLTGARRLEVTLGIPEWKLRSEFIKPDFIFVRSQKRFDNENIVVEGEILSNETLLFDNVEIGALFFNSNKTLVGVSKTSVQTIKPFERRAFTIVLPSNNISVDLEATQFYFDARRP